MNSLCHACRHVKIVTSGAGSRFYLCQLALAGRPFPKYPPQPVLTCPGFEREKATADETDDPAD